MKISIAIPTHRTSLSAIARVCEAASLNPERFEVVVRDNSADREKRALLERFRSPSVRVMSAEDRGALENASEAVRATSGDFVLLLADDDWISTKGLEKLHALGLPLANDLDVSLLTGTYFIETSSGAGFLRYPRVDSHDALERVTGYIEANAPNVIYYSAVRRSLLISSMELAMKMPYKFSFHDMTAVLMYLTAGRVVQTEHVMYFYDQSDWETQERSLAKDRQWYQSAGLPIEIDRLHWLICGLEGALIVKSHALSGYGAFNREQIANFWFSAMFQRFRHWDRSVGWSENATNEAARKLQLKLFGQSEVNLDELLIDLCDIFEVTDRTGADRYFQFWTTI